VLPDYTCDVAYILIFCAVWLNAVLRTFNNLRIMRLHYGTAIPVCLITAFIDVCVIASVVQHGVWIFIPIGLGYGLGQITAMKIYERRRPETPPENELEK